MPRPTLFDSRMDSVTYDMVDAFLAERHREDVRIQYKEPTRGTTPSIPDSTLETITAMSNSVGGIVLVGVADDNNYPKAGGWPLLPRVVGRSDQEDVILSKIAAQIMPRPLIQVQFLAPANSPDVGILVIRVESGPHPPYWCATKGIATRNGDQDRIADLATIQHLFERRTGHIYAVEQAKQQNWFSPLGDIGVNRPTVVRAVVGPADPIPRRPFAQSLDATAARLFLGSRVPMWHGISATFHPNFGEEYLHYVVRTVESGPNTYEITAYSDGVTRWSIPLSPIDPRSKDGEHDPEGFRGMQLQMTLYTAAVLGIEWLKEAVLDYQGALSYEVEVHNLAGKHVHTGHDGDTDGIIRNPLRFSTPTWRAAFNLADPDDYLQELKVLYYRFLRSGQVPALVSEADDWFDLIDQQWKPHP